MDASQSLTKPLNCSGKIPWKGGPPIKQQFPYQSSIVYYMASNPATPKGYLKLVKCCKYFFETLPLLVSRLHDDGKKICSNKDFDECETKNDCIKIDFKKLTYSKIWLTTEIQLCGNDDIDYIAPLLSSKFYCYKNSTLLNWFNDMTTKDLPELAFF